MIAAVHQLHEPDRAAAERRAERIRLRLDNIADNYAAVMPMIREAIKERDDIALGYRSPGDYVRDRFGGALERLGVDVRRAVVHELTEAGLSTRAIAPIVGASEATVWRDTQTGASREAPAPQSPESVDGGEAVADSGQTLATADGVIIAETQHVDIEPRAVVGIDGKTYPARSTRPARRETTDLPEWSNQDRAEELAQGLAGHIAAMWALTIPERRAEYIHTWKLGTRESFVLGADYITPENFRAISAALLTFANEWEQHHG